MSNQYRAPKGTTEGGQFASREQQFHEAQKKVDEAILKVENGEGTLEVFHGRFKESMLVHKGMTFADNKKTAENYGDEFILTGEVQMQGLKIATVKPFDRNDANYGALGDRELEIQVLASRGIDVIKYEDEDPMNRSHTAYRLITTAAVERFAESVTVYDKESTEIGKGKAMNRNALDDLTDDIEDVARLALADCSEAFDRLTTILNIDDDAKRKAELESYLTELPTLLQKANVEPKSIEVIQKTLVDGFVEGLQVESRT